MFKKKLILIIFLFTTSCGYESIYSKKNIVDYDFSVSNIIFEGDRNVNLKIKETLNNYTLNKKKKDFTLKVKSNSKKIILAKNKKGDPTSFKNIITVYVDILVDNNFLNNLNIEETFNYKNDKNKFNLKRYEKEIKNNLAQTATNKLIFKLSNIQ